MATLFGFSTCHVIQMTMTWRRTIKGNDVKSTGRYSLIISRKACLKEGSRIQLPTVFPIDRVLSRFCWSLLLSVYDTQQPATYHKARLTKLCCWNYQDYLSTWTLDSTNIYITNKSRELLGWGLGMISARCLKWCRWCFVTTDMM